MICDKCSHIRSCKKIINLYETNCDRFNVSAKYLKLLNYFREGDILYFINIVSNNSTANIYEAKIIRKDIVNGSIDTEIAFTGTRIRIGGSNKNVARLFYTDKQELIDYIKNNKNIKNSLYVGFNSKYFVVKESTR